MTHNRAPGVLDAFTQLLGGYPSGRTMKEQLDLYYPGLSEFSA